MATRKPASVLPEPVGAAIRVSRPAVISGQPPALRLGGAVGKAAPEPRRHGRMEAGRAGCADRARGRADGACGVGGQNHALDGTQLPVTITRRPAPASARPAPGALARWPPPDAGALLVGRRDGQGLDGQVLGEVAAQHPDGELPVGERGLHGPAEAGGRSISRS